MWHASHQARHMHSGFTRGLWHLWRSRRSLVTLVTLACDACDARDAHLWRLWRSWRSLVTLVTLATATCDACDARLWRLWRSLVTLVTPDAVIYILIIISRNVGDKKSLAWCVLLTAKARQKAISMTCTLDSQGQAPWGLGLGAWLYKSHPPPAQQAVLFLLSPWEDPQDYSKGSNCQS